MLRGGQTLRPDLDDALPMYEHYRDKSGTAMTFDFEEGYKEDAGIRREVNREMSQTLTAANELVKEGYTSIDFHSGVKESGQYPETENWQKTVGGYSYYSDSQLKVDGDTVTLTTTMTAKDRWNFDRENKIWGLGFLILKMAGLRSSGGLRALKQVVLWIGFTRGKSERSRRLSMTTLTMGLEGIGMGVIRATRGELEVKVAKGVCALR